MWRLNNSRYIKWEEKYSAVDSGSKLGDEEMKYVISDSDTIHKISNILMIVWS